MGTFTRRAAGTLAGLATCLTLAAGTAAAATTPGAAGDPVSPEMAPMLASQSCGPTAQDAAVASALNPHLNGSRLRSLDAGEVACARLIVAATRGHGLDARAATIAVTTAIAESTLHDYTQSDDYDSLGLFQQRPSQGWGTTAQVIDPNHSTNAFLSAMQSKYPDNAWMSGDIGAICQRVQVSAYPDAYDAEAPDAQLIVSALWNPGSHVLSGDVNGDGRADLVAVGQDGKMYVFTNRGGSGTQTWNGASYAGYGWTFPKILLADVNGDARADLIAVDTDGKMYVYLNKGGSGTATWGAATYAGFGWTFPRLMAADINGDGRADLVAVDNAGKMYTYSNRGGSGTQTWNGQNYAGFGWQAYPELMLSDVDGNGRADLVATDGDAKLHVYLDKGGSGTGTWGAGTYAGFGWTFPGLASGDTNGDHKAELITIHPDGKMYVYANKGGTGTQTWGAASYAGYGWNTYLY